MKVKTIKNGLLVATMLLIPSLAMAAMGAGGDVSSWLLVLGGVGLGIALFLIVLVHPLAGLLMVIFLNQVDNIISLPGGASIGRLVGLVAALAWFLKFCYTRKTALFEDRSLNMNLLLFMLALVASSLLAFSPGMALKGTLTVSMLVIMVYLIQDFVRDFRQLDIFLKTIVFSVGIGALIGVVQYTMFMVGIGGGGAIAREGIGTSHEVLRFGSVRGDPNSFAIMLMQGIPLMVFFAANSKTFKSKIIASGVALAAIVSLGLTLARTHFFGFIVFFFVYILLTYRNNVNIKKVVLITVLLIVCMGVSYNFLIDSAIERSSSFSDSSTEKRTWIMLKGVDLFMRHPVFGVGLNNFELLYPTDRRYAFISGWPGHDVISVVFAGTGLFGGTFFLLISIKTLKNLMKSIRMYSSYGNLYLMNLSITVTAAFIAMLSTSLGNPLVFERAYWIYIALAVILHRGCSKNSINSFVLPGTCDGLRVS